jgi:hypothetical protein
LPARHSTRQPSLLAAARAIGLAAALVGGAAAAATPPPPPEPVAVQELPLPPRAPSAAEGACTAAVNPHRTGCISASNFALQSGSFLPDGRQIVALVHFAGAPAAPDPASVFSGPQLVIIKTDGTTFPNGDAWKCVTCGVPAGNAVGVDSSRDYPQTFQDGKRMLAGSNIFDCSPYPLTDPRCTPQALHVYPIRWNVTPDGSGPGGMMRELRIHPDNVHLGFNSFTRTAGSLGQFAYIGRLEFNPAPKTGAPRGPRYELTHVSRLFQPGARRTLGVDPGKPDELRIDHDAIEVGEFRGFTKDGREAIYIGYPWESSNIDVFAADLASGRVRRLTSNPEYTDPVDSSPDDRWIVAMDTRGSDRQMFVAGMRGVPPILDELTTSAVSSVRNNGDRRFFQPWLIDRYGDRGAYQGQQLNAGDTRPGAAGDPNWNGMADPRWSPDGTSVVYWQSLVTSPACGGANPLPCPASTEPGGRRARIMIARLTSRKPLAMPPVAPIADSVPWGEAYVPGSPMPAPSHLPGGTYTLRGQVAGSAKVVITEKPDRSGIAAIAVAYDNYADDPEHVINGTESVSEVRPDPVTSALDWRSDLTGTGAVQATKLTSPGGFRLTINIMQPIFHATGTMTTTIDGRTYRQPGNGM